MLLKSSFISVLSFTKKKKINPIDVSLHFLFRAYF